MAMSAAAATALKKIAASAATDKRVAKTIGGIVLGAVIVLVTPILALLAALHSGANLDVAQLAAQSKNEQLQYFEQVMLSIEDEIIAQNVELYQVKAQIIYLCALQNRESEPDFYTNYITCFADGQDVFANISATFDVQFTPQDIAQIEQLITSAQQA
jgi:hypothetical protein